MFSLRDYQLNLVDKIRELFKKGVSRICLQSPTGSGKTVLIAFMIWNAVQRGKRVLFVVHRRELIEQSVETFRKFDLAPGVISAGYKPSESLVQIASVQTLARRKPPPADLCIWDECHHVAANTWKKLFAFYGKAFHIGLTATPCRLDGKGLNDFFDHLVIGPTIPWLIENNYLSKFQMFAPPGFSTESVKIRMGDFDRDELAEQASKPEVMGSAIAEYKEHCNEQQAIIFSPSINHSKRMENEFNLHGIKARHLDGNAPDATRADIVQAFRKKELKVLTNVDLFGEGFDVPGIHCVIDMSPTLSLGKYLQRVGRGLRPDIGKDVATFLDHAGNVYRHGLPDQERQWDLNGVPKIKRDTQSESVRICSSCFAAQTPRLVCQFCGETFEIKPRKILETKGSLSKIEKLFIQQKNKQEQSGARDYQSLVTLGIRRGYKDPRGWAGHIMASREKKRVRG